MAKSNIPPSGARFNDDEFDPDDFGEPGRKSRDGRPHEPSSFDLIYDGEAAGVISSWSALGVYTDGGIFCDHYGREFGPPLKKVYNKDDEICEVSLHVGIGVQKYKAPFDCYLNSSPVRPKAVIYPGSLLAQLVPFQPGNPLPNLNRESLRVTGELLYQLAERDKRDAAAKAQRDKNMAAACILVLGLLLSNGLIIFDLKALGIAATVLAIIIPILVVNSDNKKP